jgi:hypothetical protein
MKRPVSWSMKLAKSKTALAHALKLYEWVEVEFQLLLTSELGGDEWLATYPGRFTPRKNSPVPLSSRLGVT